MMIGACDYEWVDKRIIVPSITKLIENYEVTIDLKGNVEEKVPLSKALKYVLTNYQRCMRDRTFGDNIMIMKIARTIMPEFVFDEKSITGMINVVKHFADLLDRHKKHEKMMTHVMDVDEYGHYTQYKGGVRGLIAQILWYDNNGKYRLYKLQIAIDTALTDDVFGNALANAMNGRDFDESLLRCALNEPVGIHFEQAKYFEWNKSTGLPEHKCIYCGKEFYSTCDKFQHLKDVWGHHFFNGHLACRIAVSSLGKNASEKELFRHAKQTLYSWYGETNEALHTQRCKNRLLFFIGKYIEE